MNTFKITAIIFALGLSSQAMAGPININSASAEQLDQELVGVGPAIAQRIVDYRSTVGEFKDAAQLTEVKGVGDKTLSKNAQFILLK